MMRRKLLYLILLGVSAYLMLLYDYQGFRFLFLCLLSVPVLCLLGLLVTVFCCHMEPKAEMLRVFREEKGAVVVEAANRGIFPVAGLSAAVSIKLPGGAKSRKKVYFRGVLGRSTKTTAMEFTACHCGQAFFQVTGARVSDYLGLFSLPLKRQQKLTLFVMPVPETLSLELFTGTRESHMPGDSQISGSGEHDGDYLVREYRPGDNPHRIHWKLSVKEGELQVRDFETDGRLTLFLDINAAIREDSERWDHYLDRAMSLLDALAGQAAGFEVMWTAEEKIFWQEIASEEDVADFICQLLQGDEPEEKLYTENRMWLLSGLHLDADGKLYFGEQCVYE